MVEEVLEAKLRLLPAPFSAQPAEVWCGSHAPEADVGRRAEHSLSVRNQETHSLQRCTYLGGVLIMLPQKRDHGDTVPS